MSDDNPEDGGDSGFGIKPQPDDTVPVRTRDGDTFVQKTNNERRLETELPAARKGEPAVNIKKDSAIKNGLTNWFAIPAPLKRLFDRFPLVAYAENELPLRALRKAAENVLYIFTSNEDAVYGRPSFNPSCLKWQTYLKIANVQFRTVSSNNHASPSGSLPFLLVGNQKPSDFEIASSITLPEVVPGNRLKRWARDQKAITNDTQPEDFRYEAYTSLLDHSIRKAWLYQLYLHPANATTLKRLYVEPCSSNSLVQITITSQLRSAAESEITKASTTSGSTYQINEAHIMRDANEALAALSTLLGSGLWFFDNQRQQQSDATSWRGPGVFDASVFAYTHLILGLPKDGVNGVLEWKDNPLKALLQRYDNLVNHRQRILDMYY